MEYIDKFTCILVHYKGTDFQRCCKDNWNELMGMSWEPVLWTDMVEELEDAFAKMVLDNDL